jgi:hypothetical protein
MPRDGAHAELLSNQEKRSGDYFRWRVKRFGFQTTQAGVVPINRVGDPAQVRTWYDVGSLDVPNEGYVRVCRGGVFFFVRIITFTDRIFNDADFFPDEFHETFDFVDA